MNDDNLPNKAMFYTVPYGVSPFCISDEKTLSLYNIMIVLKRVSYFNMIMDDDNLQNKAMFHYLIGIEFKNFQINVQQFLDGVPPDWRKNQL